MEKFFNPHSIAIFGSMKEGKTGFEIVRNIVEGGFKGKIYPVSHSGGQIFGLNIKKDLKNLEKDC